MTKPKTTEEKISKFFLLLQTREVQEFLKLFSELVLQDYPTPIDQPKGPRLVHSKSPPLRVLSEEKLIHWLQHFKINEGNNNKPLPIHASGHASGPEIQEFVERVKPKILIPIHTTKPGLFKNDSGRVVVLERNEPFHN